MLEGMAPAVAEAAAARLGGLLLYAPIVESGDIEAAIAYLVRRLDENSGARKLPGPSVHPATRVGGLESRGGPVPASVRR